MEQEMLSSIDKKLEVIIKLLTVNLIQGKSKTEAIIALGDLGMGSNMIADIVGTTPATVTARLWEKKKSATKVKSRQIKKVE